MIGPTGNPYSIAILIPCYNCGEAALPVVKACRLYTDLIVTVNDGSTDQTSSCLEQCGTETIGWEVNRGKGIALVEGFRYLLHKDGWDAVVTLDSDGQHDPTDLSHFLKVWRETQSDIVAGCRDFQGREIPPLRRQANRYSSRLIALLTGCRLLDLQCGYRLFSRNAIERLLPHIHSERYAVETEMALLAIQQGLRMEETSIRCIYTAESSRRSSWRPWLDSWHIAQVVIRHLGKRFHSLVLNR